MKFSLFNKKELSDEEKKKKAKIQLVIFLAFIAFVFAYSRILVMKNGRSSVSREEFIYKVDLSKINKYDFNIKLDIDGNSYNYNGSVDNNNGNMGEYKIVNGEYYNANLEKVDNIIKWEDNKYFNLNNIASYINDNNLKDRKYVVNVNDIINNKLVNVDVSLNVKYSKDNTIIYIDYTNLAQSKNNQINRYNVEYTISNYK